MTLWQTRMSQFLVMEGDGVQGAGPAATHCEYCGSTAHVITTCPVAASEVEEEAQDVVINHARSTGCTSGWLRDQRV